MKNVLKWLFSALLIGLWSQLAIGKNIEETREANASFAVTPGTQIEIEGSNTYLEISSWDQDRVEVRAVLEFKGDENSRIREFIDKFEDIVKNNIRSGNGELYIDANLEEPNKVQWGTKHFNLVSIGYGDNALRISYYIKVPASNDLTVKNSYKDILMVGDFGGDVTITQYSADLRGSTFNSLDLNLKYGDARFGTIGSSTMELYEQKLEIKELGPAEINAKYSKIELEKVGNTEIDAYESKFDIHSISSLSGNMKYGELLVTGRMDKAELDTYELDVEVNEAGSIRFGKSKYGDLLFRSVEVLELDDSYEDDFDIRHLGTLNAQTKYAKFEIGELSGSITLNGYETDINLDKIAPEAKMLAVDGKYNKLQINSGSRATTLKAKLRYGKVDYPEGKMERVVYIKDGDNLEMELKSTGGSSPFAFDLKGYELKATIN